MINIKAKLDFEPPNITNKHLTQSEWKYTAVALLNDDTDDYYRWFIERRFGLKLNTPLRDAHVTFINDRLSDSKNDISQISSIFNGKEVDISYNPNEIRTNNKHWWIKVYSEELLDIREVCGFTRFPYMGLHLTIGLANERNLEHSEYIHRNILRFGL